MDAVNLFGVPLGDISSHSLRDTDKVNQETQKMLRDLVNMVEEFDEDGLAMDFSKNKNFRYYDPYNPDQSNAYAYLKYEDEAMLRASLVIDAFREDFNELSKDESLSFADKERLKQVQKLIDYLNQIKIIDAPVLLKLFNMYRQKL